MDNDNDLGKPRCCIYGCEKDARIFYIEQNLLVCLRHKSYDSKLKGVTLEGN